MGQIVKRKKKGRPSKADLARRSGGSPAKPVRREAEVRRSLRPRNVKYTIDYDDYLDETDEEEEEDEEEVRREKKVKLMKLNQGGNGGKVSARDSHAQESGEEDYEEDDGDSDSDSDSGRKPLKKRRISGGGGDSDRDEDENDCGGGGGDEDCEQRPRNADSKLQASPPGTPSDHPQTPIRLPDKRRLELILDKLQKKDTYGVYAEPVDPEELPDYHEVIEHPMDFATVRKQLEKGSYSTLEHFEGDVFLICSNAMQYNSSDTIYYKQAFSIQELAKRKFERLRIDYERSEKELKLEQKTNSNSLVKKQAKKPLCRTLQEPIGSDFSSGATLATAGDVHNSSHPTQGSGCERPSNIDGPVEGNSSLNEANVEKAEDVLSSGKGLLSKVGRKSYVVDENRRATYNLSTQPVIRPESIFTTFDSEIKEFVAVGLHAEYSYARSLARFSGSLGPVAWKVASKRIEQVLPDGFKFGRGWVGEYEPLPTPVLMLGNCTQDQSALASNSFAYTKLTKDDRTARTPVPAKEHPVREERQHSVGVPTSGGRPSFLGSSRGPYTELKPPVSGSVGAKPVSAEAKPPVSGSVGAKPVSAEAKPPVSGSVGAKPVSAEAKPPVSGSVGAKPVSAEAKPPVSGSVGAKPVSAVISVHSQKSQQSQFIEPVKKVRKEVELNSVPSINQNNAKLVAEKQSLRHPEPVASRPRDTMPRNMNLSKPVPVKRPDSNGAVTRGLPNGKAMNARLDNRTVSPSDSGPNQVERTSAFFSHGQEQGLSDPVQLMKQLAEQTQKQQRASNQSSVDTQPIVSTAPSMRRDDSNNAAAAAARAWMSIGAGAFKQPTENVTKPKSQISADSLYNPARDFHSQTSQVRGEFPMQFQIQNSFSFPTFLPQPVRMGNELQFQNRPAVFPQFAAADLSRFQGQSPWRGLSLHTQQRPRQKQESLPPDLNIGFQSPESPVKQSTGLMVDSQQPDLALQL